jgi:hypothetical protein
MKKYLNVLLPIVTLAIGLVGGWFASAHFYNRWIEWYMKTNASVNLDSRCRVLTELRAGKTNEAAETLEIMMDGDISVFGSLFRDTPADKRRPEDVRLLTAVRDYRAAHPWKAPYYSDVIDKGVADVFALVSTNQTR